jgi:hypothetical protein
VAILTLIHCSSRADGEDNVPAEGTPPSQLAAAATPAEPSRAAGAPAPAAEPHPVANAAPDPQQENSGGSQGQTTAEGKPETQELQGIGPAGRKLDESPFGLHVINNDLAGAHEIGGRWTRHLILWMKLEPRPGQMKDLARAVPRINQIHDAGFEILPRIVSVNPWANQKRINQMNQEAAKKNMPMGNWTYIGMPSDIDAYKRFVTTVVESFDGDGVKDLPGLKKGVKYWQVENEWDWRWKDSPEQFVEFLKIAHDTIKAADSEATIVLGGISKLEPDVFYNGMLGSSIQVKGRTITPEILGKQPNFKEQYPLRRKVLEDGYPYFDVISFHQYGDFDAIRQETEYLKGIMKDKNYVRRMWITEAGGPFIADGEKYTEEIQAQQVVKYYVTALASGVDVIFWSTYFPTPEWGASFANTSLMANKTQRKPAWSTYKLMATQLEGVDGVEWIADAPHAAFVRFTRGGERPVLVAWRDPKGPSADEIIKKVESHYGNRLEGKTFHVTHYDGRTETVKDFREGIRNLLDSGPIFIEVR